MEYSCPLNSNLTDSEARESHVMNKNENISEALATLFHVGKWERLAALVREYNPDIVILVARKMPRLWEVLDLQFSRTAVVITDLAIPFCHRIFNGKRVAVVDDVINYGSTMHNASEQARACGAASCRLFALAANANEQRMPLKEISLVTEQPMSEYDYEDFVRQVPAALQLISKPYDMDFPILRCGLRAPFSGPHEVWHWFMGRFGTCAHLHTTAREERQNLSRISVDFPAAIGTNMKARFYFDFGAGLCNVVPMAIPSEVSTDVPYASNTWPGYVSKLLRELLAEVPNEVSLWPDESAARARLFTHSIAFSSTVLEQVSPVLARDGALPFCTREAGMVFGPVFSIQVEDVGMSRDMPFGRADFDTTYGSEHGAIGSLTGNLPLAQRLSLQEAASSSAAKGDLTGAFHSLFDELSHAVGATNAADYCLTWPYTKEQVQARPYLRLRVGFSFQDLVDFFQEKAAGAIDSMVTVRALVSTLLDRYIDTGALVPAIAQYDKRYLRVYRKGESPMWDDETNRALYALKCMDKPISRTRFAKVQAILSYSDEITTCVVPCAYERGSVGFLPPSVADRSGTEFGLYLIQTGKLKAVKDVGK